MLHVNVLLFLSCVSIVMVVTNSKTSANPYRTNRWLEMLNVLPESKFRTNLKFGVIAVQLARGFVCANRGQEIAEVVETLFNNIPGALKDLKLKLAPSEVEEELGYMCFSEGDTDGLETISLGNVDVKERDLESTANVDFGFTSLKLNYGTCGFKTSGIKNVKCSISLGKHRFRATFKVKNVGSIAGIVVGAWKKDCVITIVDVRLKELTNFAMNIVNSKSLYEDIFSILTKNQMFDSVMHYMINRWVRYIIYKSLTKEDSFVCKDDKIENLFKKKYTRYLKQATRRSESRRFSDDVGSKSMNNQNPDVLPFSVLGENVARLSRDYDEFCPAPAPARP